MRWTRACEPAAGGRSTDGHRRLPNVWSRAAPGGAAAGLGGGVCALRHEAGRANLYPILRMEWYGTHSESTAWDGAIALFRQGQPVIAVIVFLASIVITTS